MIRLFHWLRRLFVTNQPDLIWCLTANVKENPKHLPHKILRGTKHFSPRAKVYCFPPHYDRVRVIGRHRVSKKYMCIYMPVAKLENWRLERVYSPYILRRMKEFNGWTGTRDDRERINHWAAELNRGT